MKKKKILLCLFLIIMFMFKIESVDAAGNPGTCSHNIRPVSKTKATFIWICGGTEDMNYIRIYKSTNQEKGALYKEFHPAAVDDNYKGAGDYFEYDYSGIGTNYVYVEFCPQGSGECSRLIIDRTKGELVRNSNVDVYDSAYSYSLTVEEFNNIQNTKPITHSIIGSQTKPAGGTTTAKNYTKDPNSLCNEGLRDMITEYWQWIIIFTPIFLIIFISIDFVKAVITNDADAIKKSSSAAIKRTVAVVLILFLPFLLKLIFSIFGLENYICFY